MTDLLLAAEGLRRGSRGTATSPAWVLVVDGRIAHTGPVPPASIPPGVPVLRGGWLVEPLADAHVHLFLSGATDAGERRRVAQLDDDLALDRVLGVLEHLRDRGVAAVRDAGDPRGLALRAARVANAHPGRYASVLPAGEPVFRTGRYGGFLGRGVAGVFEAAQLLARNAASGATHAKVLATGVNSLEAAGRVDPPQFAPAELAAILTEARGLGLRTMVHANGPLGWVLAADPGSLEHGFWMGEGDLETVARRRVLWVPTLGAWAALGQRPDLAPEARAVVEATDERQRAQVLRARDLGVRIAAGSDAGTPGVDHGEGLLGELRRLAGAGLVPAEALAASTHRARRELEAELGRPLGGLEPGGPAGFLWLRDDPGRNLATLASPLGTWIHRPRLPDFAHHLKR
ncbi:MAG: amidohydrolase family protein [Deferrisomatales bacterium]